MVLETERNHKVRLGERERDAEAGYAPFSQLLAFKGLVYLLTHLFSLSNDVNGTLSANQYSPEQCGRWPTAECATAISLWGNNLMVLKVCRRVYFHAFRPFLDSARSHNGGTQQAIYQQQWPKADHTEWRDSITGFWADCQYLHGEHECNKFVFRRTTWESKDRIAS